MEIVLPLLINGLLKNNFFMKCATARCGSSAGLVLFAVMGHQLIELSSWHAII
jgi:hypothetical protein